MDLVKIAANQIKSAVTGQTTSMGELWANETCVIIFFRRWGCGFCRLWAKEVSEISPILKDHNVKLIGVGIEELGIEEFKEHKFFDGDLYVATEKNVYSSLGFKRFSFLSIMTSLLWKDSRDAIAKVTKMGLGGNMKGDALQIGGALIVEKGGNLLTHFVQQGPAEHLSNSAILKALKLDSELDKLQLNEPDVKTSEGECKRT